MCLNVLCPFLCPPDARTCGMANCQYGCEVLKGEVRCQCPSPGLQLAADGRTCVGTSQSLYIRTSLKIEPLCQPLPFPRDSCKASFYVFFSAFEFAECLQSVQLGWQSKKENVLAIIYPKNLNIIILLSWSRIAEIEQATNWDVLTPSPYLFLHRSSSVYLPQVLRWATHWWSWGGDRFKHPDWAVPLRLQNSHA